jgi:hypothetical protein
LFGLAPLDWFEFVIKRAKSTAIFVFIHVVKTGNRKTKKKRRKGNTKNISETTPSESQVKTESDFHHIET